MAAKKRACKNCGYLTTEPNCELCANNAFSEKYKGTILVFNKTESIVAEKLEIINNGIFAMKYK